MLGRKRFQALLDAQTEYFARGAVVNCVQTNGVLINDAWADFFERNDIRVGISLDGPADVQDRYRPRVKGRGTHSEVIRAMDLLISRGISFGVIAVANPAADGAAVIRHFRELGIVSCDLLLPITNHALQRRADSAVNISGLKRYLSESFCEWIGGDEPRPKIRLFEAMLLNALGVHRPFANAGASEEGLSRVAVVETNGELCMDVEFGEIERHGLGAEYRLGLNVNDEGFNFERAEEALSARIKSRGLAGLSDDCRCCPARTVCRGSHPGSRYDDCDGSYNHRSAHCEAMYELSTEILHHLYQYGYGPHLLDPELRELRVA